METSKIIVIALGPIFLAATLFSTAAAMFLLKIPSGEVGVQIKSHLACSEKVDLQKVYERTRDGVIITNQNEIEFRNSSWVSLNICRLGTLNLDVSGRSASNEAARLTIILNNRTVLNKYINSRKKISLKLNETGRMYIGFTNDYERIDVRKAVLYKLNINGDDGCRGFKELNSNESGGVWNSETSTLVLAYNPPPTMQPCDAGLMTFSLYGQLTDGKTADIQLNQDGTHLVETEAVPKIIPMSIRVSKKPIEFVIKNPYGRLIDDRSLKIHSISYN